MRSGHLARLVTVAVLLAPLLAAACATVPRPPSEYRQDAARTAQAARSAVETALVVVGLVERGRAPQPYVGRTLSDVEGGLQGAVRTFSAIQPPSDELETLRTQLLAVLDEAEVVLADLRISARQGELGRLPGLAAPLPQLRDQLAELERVGAT